MSEPESLLPPAYDPTLAESKWYAVWERAGYFTPDMGAKGEPYTIVIPPPNVTGALHIGHALTCTIEDILIRWRRMCGRRALWLPGTDHAGIATQMVVERYVKETEGKTRHELGREEFLRRVWTWKDKHGGTITKQMRLLGCSVDWTRERFTMDEQLSRAVREVFVRLYDEGLIYRAKRLVNWCPRCHTALSDLEVEHEEQHEGELWSFAYPLADGSGEIVVATTRPETMLGDAAVAVHPDDPRYKGMIGKKARHPLLGYALPVIADAVLVDPEFGTGAVKVTPAHDFNDFETGKRHGLFLFNIFDRDARITAAPEVDNKEVHAQIDMAAWRAYAGLDRFAARKKVKADIAALKLEREHKKHMMALGLCQRCDTVVEPSLSTQWFVKTKPLAEPALAAVREGRTRIVPETWTKTYYHWMENIQDWCISRQLWWGHRIPAWYGPDERVFVARTEQAATQLAQRHYGKAVPLTQDADVLDTWFSSSLWPFSTLGWPDDTEDLRAFYPNSVMETGFDILFFWVARMMMMGCKMMGQPPFPIIYLHAMVRDRHGNKMSKTRGNVIDPLHLIHGCKAEEVSPQFRDDYPEGFPAFGADALRFSLAALSASGRDINLSIERIAGYRAFANKLWNAARFILMRLDGQPSSIESVRANLAPADRYILSRLAGAARDTHEALEAFRFADAASAVYSFVWHELCDWYIELVKPRLVDGAGATRRAAEATLVFVLDHALRLLHPMMPFITEEIWQRLPVARPAPSIMLAPFPHALLAEWRDPEIEREYELVRDAIVGVRTIRAESKVPPSKPVEAYLLVADAHSRARLEQHRAEIESLARTSRLLIAGTGGAKPENAAVKVLANMEVVVPLKGLVDFAEEAERLHKQIAKAEAERDKLLKKLENEAFLARAPAEIVERDKARAAELTAMMEKLRDSLARARAAQES